MKPPVIACFLFFSAAIFLHCNDEKPRKKTHEQKTLFVFEVENIDSVYYRNKLKYQIRAPLELDSIRFRDRLTLPLVDGKRKAVYLRDTTIIRYYPQGLTLKMYSDSLKDTLTLQAKKAVYSDKAGTFEFNGDVRISGGEGTIFTEQLTFTLRKGIYNTDKPIKIITADSEITGERFEMDETFSNYKIGNMKGVMKLPQEN